LFLQSFVAALQLCRPAVQGREQHSAVFELVVQDRPLPDVLEDYRFVLHVGFLRDEWGHGLEGQAPLPGRVGNPASAGEMMVAASVP